MWFLLHCTANMVKMELFRGLLEILGFPYIGSGVLSSALCMDKVTAKKIMEYEGIPTPSYQVLTTEQLNQGTVEELIKELGLPLVVKPVRTGFNNRCFYCQGSS